MSEQERVWLRRTRSARVVEHSAGVSVFPEPHAAPVLPPGWLPLEKEDETAVLAACDASPETCRLRLGSVWDAAIEYRVYCLEADEWRGVCAATLFTARTPDEDGPVVSGGNSRLLAIAEAPEMAARVALDFVNWDLESHGSEWRLALRSGQ